jgi:hypothetical protein
MESPGEIAGRWASAVGRGGVSLLVRMHWVSGSSSLGTSDEREARNSDPTGLEFGHLAGPKTVHLTDILKEPSCGARAS